MIPISSSQAHWSALQGHNSYSIGDAELAALSGAGDAMHLDAVMADVSMLNNYDQQVHKIRRETAPWLLTDTTVDTPDIYNINTPEDLIYLQGPMMNWVMSCPELKQGYLQGDITVDRYQPEDESIKDEDPLYRRVYDNVYIDDPEGGHVVSYIEHGISDDAYLSIEQQQMIIQAQSYVLKRMAIDDEALTVDVEDH